jgi:hypothetical protein
LTGHNTRASGRTVPDRQKKDRTGDEDGKKPDTAPGIRWCTSGADVLRSGNSLH